MRYVLTSDDGRRGFQRLCGLHRAAYWRALGFPNLALARAARARNLAGKRMEEAKADAMWRSGATALLHSSRRDI